MDFLLKYISYEKRTLVLVLIYSFTIAWVFASFDLYIQGFQKNIFDLAIYFFAATALIFLGVLAFGYPIILLLKKLNKHLPWYNNWIRRTMADLLLIVCIAFVTAMGAAQLAGFAGVESPQADILFYKYLTFSAIAGLTFVLMIEAVVFFNEREDYFKQINELQRENLETKLEVLQSQVNPHFLFNNLNVLSSLVYKDAVQADRFIIEFSKIYRYVLEMQGEYLASLRRELEFLDSYLYLLGQRFQNSLSIDIQVEEKFLEKKIPALSLQILMENVVKHNEISEESPMEVFISIEKDCLRMKNKLQPRSEAAEGAGLGVRNIRARYDLASGLTPSFYIEDGYYFARIPLL